LEGAADVRTELLKSGETGRLWTKPGKAHPTDREQDETIMIREEMFKPMKKGEVWG